MSNKIRPLGDRIIVKHDEVSEEKTDGGIIIPSTVRTNKEAPIQGEVIAVGTGSIQPNGNRRPLDVKVGDRILFNGYSGSDIKIDGENYLIMREVDILGVIEI